MVRILAAILHLILIVNLVGCNKTNPLIPDEASYVKSIEEWHQKRVERLKSKNGWLNLAGLFWLQEGENSFGSDPSNDIVFPEKAPGYCGNLTLSEGELVLDVREGVEIFSGDSLITSMTLEHNHSGNTTHLQQGDLVWYIIRRGEKYGIRLRDYNSSRTEQLDHIPSYPVQSDYVVEARLLPFDSPKKITVTTPVEGLTEEYECPGELRFKLKRKKLTLHPFISGEEYFLIIADQTTGLDTYGGGRFLYVTPDSTGRVIIDFNKAYNPPCAFTPFANCPLPPKENFLPVAIQAGEKSVHFD